ncbi:hypothetical protein RJ639_004032 [Escallonia herrerae]|uniref:Cytochrome P450 n=1 Tax=Escallonia herrerae TaxID=1293975 RepID=A0AA89AWI6_9ASTE|nr:hypothetical protein RJ639_004032 [Escallonia herrerae]
MCLGKDMAYIQMKSIAAAVIERFEMEVQDNENCPPQHLLSLTLRMKGGLHVIVKERGFTPESMLISTTVPHASTPVAMKYELTIF